MKKLCRILRLLHAELKRVKETGSTPSTFLGLGVDDILEKNAAGKNAGNEEEDEKQGEEGEDTLLDDLMFGSDSKAPAKAEPKGFKMARRMSDSKQEDSTFL